MTVKRAMPILTVTDIAAATRLYSELTGMEVVMDLGWIVTLASSEDPSLQLSLMTRDQTASVNPNVSIQVEDVDAAYASAVQSGTEIVHDLTDEPWGVRRFFIRDEAGNVVNILRHN